MCLCVCDRERGRERERERERDIERLRQTEREIMGERVFWGDRKGQIWHWVVKTKKAENIFSNTQTIKREGRRERGEKEAGDRYLKEDR